MALTATGWHRKYWTDLMNNQANNSGDVTWTAAAGVPDSHWRFALYTNAGSDTDWESSTGAEGTYAGYLSTEVASGDGYTTGGDNIGTDAADRLVTHDTAGLGLGTIFMSCTTQTGITWNATGAGINNIYSGAVRYTDTADFIVVGYKFTSNYSIADGGTFTVNWATGGGVDRTVWTIG